MTRPKPPSDTPAPPETSRQDVMDLALVAAHQLKSPLGSIQSSVNLLLGGFVGTVTPRQRELLEAMYRKAGQGVDLVADLLRLRSLQDLAPEDRVPLPVVTAAHAALDRVRDAAEAGGVRLQEHVDLPDPESAWVLGEPAVVAEILHVLLENAVKYTPQGGEVTLTVSHSPGLEPSFQVEVADTGIGIPPEAWDRLFTEFYRAPNAKALSREGTGLGLSFARRATERLLGRLDLGPRPSGGVVARLVLPASPVPGTNQVATRTVSRRVVVVGGVTAGSKAAARIMRLDPDAEVTIVERGRLLSYAGCGLPYYISGAVRHQRDLLSSPLGDVRDSAFFHNLKNVRTLDLTEAVAIHRHERRVTVRRLTDGQEQELPYDQLVLATGARARIPELEGVELDHIHTLHGVEDAEAIREGLRSASAKDVVIVGGGILGCEIAESVAIRGARITLVEAQAHILGIIEPDLARRVQRHVERRGVRVITGVEVSGFAGTGAVQEVVLADGRRLPCDFAILATGVAPNSDLARAAGLELGLRGAVKIDAQQRTSDPRIFAVGDCAEGVHLLTGQPTWVPMGSTALKQGRVAAANVCGREETFPGVVGSILLRVFDTTVARTGFITEEARKAGFDPIRVTIPGPDRAHYLPTAADIVFRLVSDRRTGKVLGAQCVGPGEAAKRVDVVATAITAGMDLHALGRLDLGFAPAYSLAVDTVLTAAHVTVNRLEGLYRGVDAETLHRQLASNTPPVVLDVRLPAEYRAHRIKGSLHVPLGALRGRLHEIPAGRAVAVVCTSGLRSYEAALVLRHRGFADVVVLDGGLDVWPYDLEAV